MIDDQARELSTLNSISTSSPGERDEVADEKSDDDDKVAASSAYPRPSSLDPLVDREETKITSK